MRAIHLIPITCSILIITAGCSLSNQTDQNAIETNSNTEVPVGGIVAGSIEPSITFKQMDHDVSFTFQLKNQTEHIVTYHFSSSQRFDYKIKNESGDVVKQFSINRSFAQVKGEVTLKQAETIQFDTSIKNLPKGKYSITFWLTAREAQPQETLAFQVD